MTEKKNTQNNNLMKDKLGVIMGLANERSLAWGIAESLYASQANIILTYQGEVLGKRVKQLSQKIVEAFVHHFQEDAEQNLFVLINNWLRGNE